MCDIYRNFDSAKMDSWRKFFSLLELGEPILWHCTAGKDRTGMTSAIVLYALGVDPDAIRRDYLLTNECSFQTVQQTILSFREKFGDAMAMKLKDLVIAKALYLDTYVQAIQDQFGGWDGLLGELGVHKERLRELYLESSKYQE
jgi:protein-tyrosine phosphatase